MEVCDTAEIPGLLSADFFNWMSRTSLHFGQDMLCDKQPKDKQEVVTPEWFVEMQCSMNFWKRCTSTKQKKEAQ